ncbi:MAG: PadR family transcriptional regulator [Deltaproteobacteria bacterium HGW-Deltaproteobacteria-15]|nr:MAG: PadR family transcriptional regulator [Deltaproteobacteria bacterium HGW-Deltaproteobacteria-15]
MKDMIGSKDKSQRPRKGKRERYIQPSILLGLCAKPSYGYELIQNIHKFGFVKGQAPPGMIYRHLHQLEGDGLVSSEWNTEAGGPAKRMYYLTDEGKETLALWVEYMDRQAKTLNAFVKEYRTILKRGEEESG